jgi:hypothetical protein
MPGAESVVFAGVSVRIVVRRRLMESYPKISRKSKVCGGVSMPEAAVIRLGLRLVREPSRRLV